MIREPVNLTSLSKDDLKKFLSGFDHVFSDCDGVLWDMSGALPGSGKFLEVIKKLGKTVNFVSNSSLRTKEEYNKLFHSLNVENGHKQLTIPSMAITEFLKSKNFNKHIYCVTNPETIKVLESHGFKCKSGPQVGSEDLKDYADYLKDDEEIGAVVFDADFRVNLPKVYKAITYLKRPEVFFLNGASDKLMPFGNGVTGVGVQVLTDVVIERTNRQPVQCAKPSRDFGELAMRHAGVTDPSRVLFIGDMIQQDVGLGKNTGFKTMLLLTTFTKEDMLAETHLRPDYYAPSLGSIAPLLEALL